MLWVEAHRPEAPRVQMVSMVSLTARADSPFPAGETVAVDGGGGGSAVQPPPGSVIWSSCLESRAAGEQHEQTGSPGGPVGDEMVARRARTEGRMRPKRCRCSSTTP